MAEFAVVQAASPTSLSSTVDFTSTGFGTPKGAIFFAGKGVTNGTAVDHAMIGVGFFDGTNSVGFSTAREDFSVASNSNCANFASGNPTRTMQLPEYTGANIGLSDAGNGGYLGSAAWITDGVRLTVNDAPASAYLITCVLIGGSGVSNVYVGDNVTPTTIDTATDITDPGFQPDIVLAINRDASGINGTRDATQSALGFGFCTRNSGGNPHPQYCFATLENDNVGTTTGNMVGDTGAVARQGASTREIELRDFDASGFSAYLRIVTGTAMPFGYMAIKLSGLSAAIVNPSTPTSTGSNSITGAGFTPQFGLMLHSALTVMDTVKTDTESEVFGISALTTAAQYCTAFSSQDAVTTPNTDSLTDSKPVALRKAGAAFVTASYTAFTSDGVTFNYSAVDASARKQLVLFVSSGTVTANAPSVNDGVTVTDQPTMHMPINVPMMKLT